MHQPPALSPLVALKAITRRRWIPSLLSLLPLPRMPSLRGTCIFQQTLDICCQLIFHESLMNNKREGPSSSTGREHVGSDTQVGDCRCWFFSRYHMGRYVEHQLAARSRAGRKSSATINAGLSSPKPAAAEQLWYWGHGESSLKLKFMPRVTRGFQVCENLSFSQLKEINYPTPKSKSLNLRVSNWKYLLINQHYL